MTWFAAENAWLSRLVIQRGTALVYLVAFAVARNQFPALLGENGLLPATRFVRAVPFKRSPSLFHLGYSDRRLAGVAWAGIILAAVALAGGLDHVPTAAAIVVWLVLWVLYESIVNVGQTFYGFGWESLLLETGFLVAFLGNDRVAPPALIIWLARWLVFRLEFGAGLIKLRGDRCWRDLTCLYYHHETQPMPNPLSWYFHHLPKPMHRVEVFANHVTQLVVPFALFLPQPIAGVAGLFIVVTQGWLMSSGNFSWLNALTMVLAFAAFDDSLLHHVLPVGHPAVAAASSPGWFEVVVIAVSALIVGLSYWPARNLVSKSQRMNASFNPLHLVNTYGAFGSITRVRQEIVVEGTLDADLTDQTEWHAYEFRGKPTDPRRRPPQIAPYHLRLDWLMWFAALSPGYAEGWFVGFLRKLLENDRRTLKLIRRNPFPGGPPTYVRARLFRYRFTTREERNATGDWWHRTYAGNFVRPIAASDFGARR